MLLEARSDEELVRLILECSKSTPLELFRQPGLAIESLITGIRMAPMSEGVEPSLLLLKDKENAGAVAELLRSGEGGFTLVVDCTMEGVCEATNIVDNTASPCAAKHTMIPLPIPTKNPKISARYLRSTSLPSLSLSIHKHKKKYPTRQEKILIVSGDPEDTGVVVALFVACLLFGGDGGQYDYTRGSETDTAAGAPKLDIPFSKTYVRMRLAWIMASLGERAGPSRGGLNAVNSVLMG